jgi:hypothetical protein
MKKITAILSSFVLCTPLFVLAHPGHGEHGGYTITHYFTEPMHVFVSLSILVAVVVVINYLGRDKQQQENS